LGYTVQPGALFNRGPAVRAVTTTDVSE